MAIVRDRVLFNVLDYLILFTMRHLKVCFLVKTFSFSQGTHLSVIDVGLSFKVQVVRIARGVVVFSFSRLIHVVQ